MRPCVDQDLGDLAADQLVALEQRVAERLDQVSVVFEQRGDLSLRVAEDRLDALTAFVVTQHLGDDIACAGHVG